MDVIFFDRIGYCSNVPGFEDMLFEKDGM